jgi:hypothetical protein
MALRPEQPSQAASIEGRIGVRRTIGLMLKRGVQPLIALAVVSAAHFNPFHAAVGINASWLRCIDQRRCAFGLYPTGTRQRGPAGFFCLNVLGENELSKMLKNTTTVGPMRTQPIERGSIMPTQMSALMPTVGMVKVEKAPQPKKKLTRTEPCAPRRPE